MRKYFAVGALALLALPAIACDQCGCGLLLGVQPKDHANNFGLQWRMRYLRGDLLVPGDAMPMLKHGGQDHDGDDNAAATYREAYNVLEARGQVWLTDRASLTASIPLLHNFQSVGGVRQADVYGVGDPVLLARYAVLASLSGPDTTRLRHRLTVGMGLKVPLGRTNVVQDGEELDHDLQPGTGTWDPLLSLEYTLRGKSWGLALATLGRYNGEGADGFRMGHSASATAELFRVVPHKQVTWVPSAGAYAEAALPDAQDGVSDPGTGGKVLFSHLGLRVWWKNLGLACTWQHALVNDQGAMMVPNRERFIAGITYSFDQD